MSLPDQHPRTPARVDLVVPPAAGLGAVLDRLSAHPAVERFEWLHRPRRLRIDLRDASAVDYFEFVLAQAAGRAQGEP